MKAMIKAFERLYKDIDDIQLMWVKSTKDSDEEGKRFAIGLMHTTMNSVSQFLKCIIDRKDNIVDLGEVWHDIKEEPEYGNTIVYVTKLNKIGTLKRVGKNRFTWYIEKYAIYKWAYLEDLLPKGGE